MGINPKHAPPALRAAIEKAQAKDDKQIEREFRRSKYNAKKTLGPLPLGLGERTYDSKREAAYAVKLERAVANGVIRWWLPQVNFPLDAPSGVKSRTYRADFVIMFADGHVEVHDAKGMKTQAYKQKARAMKQIYNIDIVEV